MDIKYNNIAFHTRLAILMKKKINFAFAAAAAAVNL